MLSVVANQYCKGIDTKVRVDKEVPQIVPVKLPQIDDAASHRCPPRKKQRTCSNSYVLPPQSFLKAEERKEKDIVSPKTAKGVVVFKGHVERKETDSDVSVEVSEDEYDEEHGSDCDEFKEGLLF